MSSSLDTHLVELWPKATPQHTLIRSRVLFSKVASFSEEPERSKKMVSQSSTLTCQFLLSAVRMMVLWESPDVLRLTTTKSKTLINHKETCSQLFPSRDSLIGDSQAVLFHQMSRATTLLLRLMRMRLTTKLPLLSTDLLANLLETTKLPALVLPKYMTLSQWLRQWSSRTATISEMPATLKPSSIKLDQTAQRDPHGLRLTLKESWEEIFQAVSSSQLRTTSTESGQLTQSIFHNSTTPAMDHHHVLFTQSLLLNSSTPHSMLWTLVCSQLLPSKWDANSCQDKPHKRLLELRTQTSTLLMR